jgi:hypothetical protein
MYRRPDWVRRVVAMGPSVGGAEHLVALDADEIIATAVRSTGLDDFGPSTWEEPFRRLVTALDTEARLHALGRLETKHDLLRHLRTRLLVVGAGEPEQVVAPVFVTGPARSGTSILHELLGEDPALRAPLAWEMAQPFAGEDGPALAECEFDLWADIQPEFAAVHELSSRLPEECLWLLAPEFDSGFWATCTNVPSFMAWRAGTDAVPTYEWHRRMLGTLQRGRTPRPWALKSPVHVSRLPALFAVYPDARVVLTHRDPVKTVPSSVSAVAGGRWLRSDAVDPVAIGASLQFGLGCMLNALPDVVATLPAGQVAHLHYLDLLRDPVGAITGAYESLGMPVAPELPARILAYLEARPQDKHGVHRYSAADFGLDVDEIRRAFMPYTDAFGVEHE